VEIDLQRRSLVRNSLLLGAAMVSAPLPLLGEAEDKKSAPKELEVTATEDLMREHGVIRRALLVYFEVAPKLRQNSSSVDPAPLRQTAQLFRTLVRTITSACSRSSIFSHSFASRAGSFIVMPTY
jgi:hypothetical protein